MAPELKAYYFIFYFNQASKGVKNSDMYYMRPNLNLLWKKNKSKQ